MKKKWVINFIVLFFPFVLFSQNNIPMLFKLKWGATFNEVQDRIIRKDVNLGQLFYYNIYDGRTEQGELKSGSTVKYYSTGSPLFNIPAEVIFTFYNVDGQKTHLELSKIEVFLEKKDNNGIWIDIKEIYRDVIRYFLENYHVNLQYSKERQIFSRYDFQITVNGVYVNFIANVGNNILNNDKSIYISYESNQYQHQILKKEKTIMEQLMPQTKEDKIITDTRSNL